MRIYKLNPYPNKVLNALDVIAHHLMRPWRVCLDQCLSCFVPTTKDLKTPHIFLGACLLTAPVYFLLFILTTLPGITGLLLWICISHKRSNFRMSVSNQTQLAREYLEKNSTYMKTCTTKNSTRFKTTDYDFSQSSFAFATLNVCFLQEVLSRYNNLSHTAKRADLIGQRLANNQLKFKNKIQNQMGQNGYCHNNGNHNGQYISNGNTSNGKENGNHINDIAEQRLTYPVKVNDRESIMDVTVRTEFPDVDFMVFQETWDNKLAECLMSHLHKIYPYVVYDTGEIGLRQNAYCANSALMIASKVPIIEVQFNLYPYRYMHDKLSSKGLLQVKVDLGVQNGKRKVGLIHSTHLQVYPGTSPVRIYQLDNIAKWAREFRSHSEDEVIAFDVLAGDFNFDNTSPVDSRDFSHHLFTEFRDICRIKAGEDHPFVVGTDMRHTPLYDDLISTPAGLKAALDDPILRQYYIVNGNLEGEVTAKTSRELTELDKDGNVIPHPLGGRRRLDYILFKECDKVTPTAYNNVTLLAGLTDHVCLSMALTVNEK